MNIVFIIFILVHPAKPETLAKTHFHLQYCSLINLPLQAGDISIPEEIHEIFLLTVTSDGERVEYRSYMQLNSLNIGVM
ncbi:MAG: hypothetical protein EAX81_03220 [Candidatus Thorarchaeota archaeon]|nr:hypothetical protein [Candidatus Thorarchaeota archaeon]